MKATRAGIGLEVSDHRLEGLAPPEYFSFLVHRSVAGFVLHLDGRVIELR